MGGSTIEQTRPTEAQLRQELDSLRQQLQQAQRLLSVGTVAAMVVHEFNNILMTIQNYSRLAAEGDDDMRTRAMRRISEAADRADAICRSLLGLVSSADRTPQSVKVAQLAKDTLSAMGRELTKDGIALAVKVPAKLTIRTCPLELKQVLLNLLLNARAAVLAKRSGRSMKITARRQNGWVLLSVADTGTGIPRDIRQRIFEPFFTTHADTGSGLGLAVCRQIVEGLQGRLTVRSQQGKGSRFTIALPAAGPSPASAQPLPALAAVSA